MSDNLKKKIHHSTKTTENEENEILDDDYTTITKTDNYEEYVVDIIIDEENYEDGILITTDDDEDEDFCEKIMDDDDDLSDDKTIVSNINQDDSESDLDIYFKFGTNNHKLEGKHSLKRDTILNGKQNISTSDTDEDSHYINMSYYDSAGNSIDTDDYGGFDNISIEKGSVFEDESRRGDEILSKRKLSQDVYDLLKNNTDLDFNANRRKPNKDAFNEYYKMLINNINKQYSKCDIFVELSYYFTDNTFNMYKLLDKKYATEIIMELRDKGYLKNLDMINFM